MGPLVDARMSDELAELPFKRAVTATVLPSRALLVDNRERKSLIS